MSLELFLEVKIEDDCMDLDGFGDERLERFDRCLRDFGMCLGDEPTPKAHLQPVGLIHKTSDSPVARDLGRQLGKVLAAGILYATPDPQP